MEFSCCIDSEFIKFQPIILYLYRTVVEPKISTILAGKNRNAIQYQFAIYQRLLGATRNIQITIHITGQRSHLSGINTLATRSGKCSRVAFTSRLSFLSGLEPAYHPPPSLPLCHDSDRRSGIVSLFAWQPGGSHCHVTNSLTFISQFINSCFNRKLKILSVCT